MGTTRENDDVNGLEPTQGTEQAVNMADANITEESRKIEAVSEQEESRKAETAGKTPESRKDSIRQEYGFASDVKLKECRFCCVMIPKKAKICPNCKMNLKSHWFLKSIAVILTVAVIVAGSYYLSAYWGLIDDAVMPVWMARHRAAAPAMSVASMDPEGANRTVVEAIEATEEENQTMRTASEDIEKQASDKVSTEEEKQASDKVSAEEEKQASDKASMEEEKQASDKVSTEEEKQASDKASMEGEKQASDVSSIEEKNQADREAYEDEGRQTTRTQAAAGETAEKADKGESADQTQNGDIIEDETDAEAEGSDKEASVPGQKEPEADLDKEIPESADEDEAAFRSDCVQVDYKTLLRKQQDYVNTALMIEAQVVCQIDGGLFDDNTYYLCVTEEKNGIKRYYIIRDDRQADDTLILEGDTLTVYGRLFGDCRIPAKLIETRPTVPALSMLYYDLIED